MTLDLSEAAANLTIVDEAFTEEYRIEMELLKQECASHDPSIFDYPPAGCDKLKQDD